MSEEKEFTSDLESKGLSDDELVLAHDKLAEEKPNPAEGFSIMPIIMLGLASALIFFVGVILAKDTAKFAADVYDPHHVFVEGGAAIVYDPVKQGKKLYDNNCLSCHKASGAGLAGAFPPLDGSQWVLGSEERLVKLVWNGLQGPIKVKGNEYNGIMPAFNAKFSPKQMAEVLTYIRQAWSNEAAGLEFITEERAAAIIDSIGGRSNAWTGDELLQLYPME